MFQCNTVLQSDTASREVGDFPFTDCSESRHLLYNSIFPAGDSGVCNPAFAWTPVSLQNPILYMWAFMWEELEASVESETQIEKALFDTLFICNHFSLSPAELSDIPRGNKW